MKTTGLFFHSLYLFDAQTLNGNHIGGHFRSQWARIRVVKRNGNVTEIRKRAAGSGRREGGREAGRRRLLDAEEGSLGGREVGEEGRECTGEGVEVLQAGLGVGSREAGCSEGHSVPEADDPGRLESLEMASGVDSGEFPELEQYRE